MTEFSVSPMRFSTVAYLYQIRQGIRVDPPYQRQGEVWSKAKQRLLIDSIINKFDIPKIYFHEHTRPIDVDGRRVQYSLVDGRQRLEAIWDFIDGRFELAEDFVLLETNSTEAAGKTYAEIAQYEPGVIAEFSATPLDIMLIRTEDVELIEEMFSRLNEAVPLNAAEKRNGLGGPLRPAVRRLVEDQFFKDRLPFPNTRYRHYDLATKFLYWVESQGPADTKKRQLDEFWIQVKEASDGDDIAEKLLSATQPILGALAGTFVKQDTLLASIGIVSVFFLLYRELVENAQKLPTRAQLVTFDQVRRLRRFEDEDDLTAEQYRLLQFDRYAQSPNDETALEYRLNVLRDYLRDPRPFSK
jgi:Protein of unknown function DUF262